MEEKRKKGTIFFALFILTITPLIAKTAPFEVELYTRRLAPGEAVLIKVIPNLEIVAVSGTFIGKRLKFIKEGTNFIALSGIPLDTSPGDYHLYLSAILENGFVLKRRIPIRIREVSFPSEKLAVDPRFIKLSAEDLARVREESKLLKKVYRTSSPTPFWRGRFILPVESEVISSFGVRRMFNGELRGRHYGVDLRAPTGTKIRAGNSGKVVLARNLFFGGNTVIIDHGEGLFTIYCHLSRILISEGEMVEKGEIIGLSGMTGRVTGPHLHFGAKVAGIRVDPLSLLFLPLD